MLVHRARFASLFVALVLALTLLPPPSPTAAAPLSALDQSMVPPDLASLYFPPTSHNLSGGFLRYWWTNGQLAIFGFPISEEFTQDGRTVQYFERARFEYFPEHRGTIYEVQLGHLGRHVTQERLGPPAFQPIPAVGESPERDYFEPTHHSLAYAFKNFWEAHNGLYSFGYPISEEFSENGRTVQYFERARFEWHPDNPEPYKVLLGHLGMQVAREHEAPLVAVGRRGDATTWTPTLAEEYAQRLREQQHQVWLAATPSPLEPFQATVTVPATEIRTAPTTAGALIRLIYARHVVHVVGVASGEPVDGDDRWYQLAAGEGYIPAVVVEPFTPAPPPLSWPGRWIDINLSSFYITGYEGATPLYSALITAGRDDRTPLGIFSIQRRVLNETMDSATVGIPKGHREYYYLTNVRYTQYITAKGHAIHGNYWVHPSRFGRFSSNGCAGLLNADAAWFWEFADLGTPVHIHF